MRGSSPIRRSMTSAMASIMRVEATSPSNVDCSSVRTPAISSRSLRMPTSTKAGSGHSTWRMRRVPGLPFGSGSVSSPATSAATSWA